jgi:ABC-2 type transport system permease protein
MSQAQGEIFDLGYQHYEGPRGGRLQGVWSLWVNGFRTILGLGRGARAKILPVAMSLVAIAPPAVYLLLAAVSPAMAPVSHADFYEGTSLLLLLFAAIIAPELLIPDRRNRVTTLYLVRPLSSFDYIAARWSAFLLVTLAVALFGQVLVLGGHLLVVEAPGDFLRENWDNIPRFIFAGTLIAVFVTTIPLAVAAITDRRAYAAAFVIAIFIITTPMSAMLTTEWCEADEIHVVRDGEITTEYGEESCGRITGDFAKWFVLLDVGRAPTHLSDLIFDDDSQDDAAMLVEELPVAVPIAWYGLLVLGPGALMLLRYRSMSI